MVQMLKTAVVAVEDRAYAIRIFELRTPRGQRRYSAENALGPNDQIILDDDSALNLEARALRLVPATVYSRILARATAA